MAAKWPRSFTVSAESEHYSHRGVSQPACLPTRVCVCVHYRSSDQAKKHITFLSAHEKVNCHSHKRAALCIKHGDGLQETWKQRQTWECWVDFNGLLWEKSALFVHGNSRMWREKHNLPCRMRDLLWKKNRADKKERRGKEDKANRSETDCGPCEQIMTYFWASDWEGKCHCTS